MNSPSPGVKDKKSFLPEFEPLYEHLVERDEFLNVLISPWLFIILQDMELCYPDDGGCMKSVCIRPGQDFNKLEFLGCRSLIIFSLLRTL